MAMWRCSWRLDFLLLQPLGCPRWHRREAVWSACDTFWEFDTAHSGAITREVGSSQPWELLGTSEIQNDNGAMGR